LGRRGWSLRPFASQADLPLAESAEKRLQGRGFGVAGHDPGMGKRLEDFYRDLMWQLGEHAQRGGTGVGAAAVVKRVGLAHNVGAASTTPLPRLTRAERDAVAWQNRP
jgi:hypothetical protein